MFMGDPPLPASRDSLCWFAGDVMPRSRFDRDYYGILGVPPEAAEEEVRRAYRRLALEWHPDRRGGDPRAAERFKEISEAYAVLSSPVRRGDYDAARQRGTTAAWGRAHRQEGPPRGPGPPPHPAPVLQGRGRAVA